MDSHTDGNHAPADIGPCCRSSGSRQTTLQTICGQKQFTIAPLRSSGTLSRTDTYSSPNIHTDTSTLEQAIYSGIRSQHSPDTAVDNHPLEMKNHLSKSSINFQKNLSAEKVYRSATPVTNKGSI